MKNTLTFILLTTAIIAFYSCNSKKSEKKEQTEQVINEEKSEKYWVKNIGSRLKIIDEGDFSATISIDSLINTPNLYAIGPIEGLKGEITINDGEISVATMENDNPKFSSTALNTKAIFMVYGSCSDWKKISIEKPLSGIDEIEAYIKEKIPTNGLDMEKPFPFRIEGNVNSLNYHIIYKKDNAPHNMAEHQKSKQKFEIDNENIEIIGFWADSSGEKVYTHPGHRTHIHFIKKDSKQSGHIDDIKLEQGATLYLPLIK